MKIAVVISVASLAAAGAILLNLALLGGSSSQNDPVGRLSPRAVLTHGTPDAPPTRVVTVGRGGEADD